MSTNMQDHDNTQDHRNTQDHKMQGHNHGGKNHLLMMGGIAVLVFVVLILFGKPVGEALPLALFAACPLMMIGMMYSMRGGGNQQQNGVNSQQQHGGNGQQQNGGNDLRDREVPIDPQDSVRS